MRPGTVSFSPQQPDSLAVQKKRATRPISTRNGHMRHVEVRPADSGKLLVGMFWGGMLTVVGVLVLASLIVVAKLLA
jgi:hypothetical protein